MAAKEDNITLPHEKEMRKLGPIGSPTGPTEDEMEERRKSQFIIDPSTVEAKEDLRVRLWCYNKMQQHESKLTPHCTPNEILASGDIEPEDVDIKSIYNFEDMHWFIFRRDGSLFRRGPKQMLFHITIIAVIPKARGGAGNHIILCKSSFAKL